MGKIISTLALVIMIVLFPPAALITISQGAVQGDRTYPVKRWLEDQVLLLASLNPTTRAYFAVALSNRRYDESAKLLSTGDNASSTLEELVTQSNVAAGDINKISSVSQKSRLIADLSNSIAKYDQGLAQAQEQISGTTPRKIQIQTPQPSPKASIITTPKPSSTGVSSTPAPSSVSQPTPKPSATGLPTPRPSESPADEEARRQQEAIEKARRELEELRKKLEAEQIKLQQESITAQNANSTSSPTPSPKPSPSPSRTPSPSPSPSPSPRPSPSPSPLPTRTPAPSPSSRSTRGSSQNTQSLDGGSLSTQTTGQHGSQEGSN